MLRLRKDEAVAIGVDITPRITTIATANLAGKILEEDSFETSPEQGETFEKLVSYLAKFKSKIKNKSVLVGISVPGMVDETNGIVTYIPYFQWKNWKLKQKVQSKIGLPVVIDNDANAIALAELWFGRPEVRSVKNFVSVLVVDGIGTGIIFEGQIYRGNKGAAGEFGHMVLGEENNVVHCSCGNTQCWEAFASNIATVSRYSALTNQKIKDVDTIFDLAAKGDKAALKIVIETTKYLGLGIVNLIVGLSPEAVIISGKIALIWPLIEKELLSTIKENIRQELPPTKIIASTLGDHPTLMGAISLSLIDKFASAT
jgi:predicted NBD/HSP70 family sugar kinase